MVRQRAAVAFAETRLCQFESGPWLHIIFNDSKFFNGFKFGMVSLKFLR